MFALQQRPFAKVEVGGGWRGDHNGVNVAALKHGFGALCDGHARIGVGDISPPFGRQIHNAGDLASFVLDQIAKQVGAPVAHA